MRRFTIEFDAGVLSEESVTTGRLLGDDLVAEIVKDPSFSAGWCGNILKIENRGHAGNGNSEGSVAMLDRLSEFWIPKADR